MHGVGLGKRVDLGLDESVVVSSIMSHMKGFRNWNANMRRSRKDV